MNIRSAKKEESKKIIDLAVRVFKPNMGQQFIRLFSAENHEHQMIAEDQGKIIAAVNYYPTLIDTSIGVFSGASIGAVCTDEAYRGQGISSKLLNLAEKKMFEENIDFCIISGDGPLYQRFGARDVGAMNRYIIKDMTLDTSIDIRRFQGDPHLLYPIFEQETIKYQRSKEEFYDLFIAQTYPDNYQSYPVYTIHRKGHIVAYVICVHHPRAKLLSIKEYAGDRELIIQSLPFLVKHHKKEGIELTTSIHDPIQELIHEKPERITQHATLKIIHAERFLSKINHFCMLKHYPLMIQKSNDMYCIQQDHHVFELDHDAIHSLIFSGIIPSNIEDTILKNVFPIELPWSHNINYQ